MMNLTFPKKIIFFPENSKQFLENSSGQLRIKFGIDPTRDRMHLGHFVPLRICRKLQEQGHHLDIIIGTLTAQLGDPSGQDQTRPFLSEIDVQRNAEKLLSQIQRILLPGFSIHRNHEFTKNMSIPAFLSKLASKFTVANMLARDGFRERCSNQQPIALHELMVPLLQGWDSVVLKSEVEIGGSDQLFNFQVARELQTSEGQKPEMCIMVPIIRGTDGRKMSKTFNNTIWIDENPDEMFGKIMSISDDVMEEWIDILTNLSELPEHPMLKKKLLAASIVEQFHGKEAAINAEKKFENIVQNKNISDCEIVDVKLDSILKIVATTLQESNGAARRLISQGGVSLNGNKIFNWEFIPNIGDIVKVGKRKFVRIID